MATHQLTHRGHDLLAAWLSLVDSVAPVAHHLHAERVYAREHGGAGRGDDREVHALQHNIGVHVTIIQISG